MKLCLKKICMGTSIRFMAMSYNKSQEANFGQISKKFRSKLG